MKKKKIILLLIPFFIISIAIIIIGFQYFSTKNEKELKKLQEKNLVQSNQWKISENQIKIVTEYIRIREKKSVNSNIIGKVKEGEIYTVLDDSDTSKYKWIKIETSNGIKGYISGQEGYVISLNNNISTPETNNDTNNIQTPQEQTTNVYIPPQQPPTVPNIPNQNTQQSSPSTSPKPSTNPIPKPTEKEKKSINATKEYKCPSPAWEYNSIQKTCSYMSANNDYRVYQCLDGYEYSNGLCQLTNKLESIEPKNQITCTSGNQYLTYVGGQYSCRKGSISYKKVCPAGYTLKYYSGTISIYACVDKRPSSMKPTTICTEGYTLSTEGFCYKIFIEPATISYSCPDGYTLKEDKCYEK